MQVVVILDVTHKRVQASIVTQHDMSRFHGEIQPASEQSLDVARNAQLALADAVAFAEKINIRHGALDES